MPGDVVDVSVFVLPAVTLPLTFTHTVVCRSAEPESTRMPARAAFVAIGAATVLFRIRAVMELPSHGRSGSVRVHPSP